MFDKQLQVSRSNILQEIRGFFGSKDFLEVDTPILSPHLIPEINIEVFKTDYITPYNKKREVYLVPSPEVWMKRALAQGSGNIFQISKCFRNSESIGSLHNPEFTMLEWYEVEANYFTSMVRTEELFQQFNKKLYKHVPLPFRRLSVEEVFWDFTKIDLKKNISREDLWEEALKLGAVPEKEDSWEIIYNRVFLEYIEPYLPMDKPLILYNYPAQISCLAKAIAQTPWCERWELYIQGIELANCFTEEDDPLKIACYFNNEGELKSRQALVAHHIDSLYFKKFEANFPRCSGVALGIERLLMVLTNKDSIDQVMNFPFSHWEE